jgi:hypothetical protein
MSVSVSEVPVSIALRGGGEAGSGKEQNSHAARHGSSRLAAMSRA